MNTIGIDFEVYSQNFGTSNTTYLVTHTLSNRPRTESNATGSYVAGVAYSDANGNSAYDIGEGLSITEINGQAVSGNDHGLVSSYLPHGSNQLTVRSGGTTLFNDTVQLVDRNLAFVQGNLQQPTEPETIGLFEPSASIFHLKESFTPGNSDHYFQFGAGASGWTPIVGDWDGDGVDTVGFYQADASLFHLKNSHGGGVSDIYFAFGPAGAGWIPLAGDWDGDGTDTIGLFQPDLSRFHLKNSFTPGNSDVLAEFGGPNSGWTPLVGDWDGDGTDTIGLYQGDTSMFHLKNDFTPGAADLFFAFGPGGNAGWNPLAGDFDGDGVDTVGFYQGDASLFHLKNSLTPGASDIYFAFGPAGAGWTPLIGNWSATAPSPSQSSPSPAKAAARPVAFSSSNSIAAVKPITRTSSPDHDDDEWFAIRDQVFLAW